MAERRRGHDDDLARLGDARRDEHPLPGQEIQFAQEPPWPVPGHDLLVMARAHDDFDRAGEQHIKVVGRIAVAEEVFAGGDRPPCPYRVQGGDVIRAEGGKRDCIRIHPGRVPSAGEGLAPRISRAGCGRLPCPPTASRARMLVRTD